MSACAACLSGLLWQRLREARPKQLWMVFFCERDSVCLIWHMSKINEAFNVELLLFVTMAWLAQYEAVEMTHFLPLGFIQKTAASPVFVLSAPAKETSWNQSPYCNPYYKSRVSSLSNKWKRGFREELKRLINGLRESAASPSAQNSIFSSDLLYQSLSLFSDTHLVTHLLMPQIKEHICLLGVKIIRISINIWSIVPYKAIAVNIK